MKALKIVKKYYKIVLLIVAVAALFACYSVLHDIATAIRGYEAVGGELFIFLLPYLVYVTIKNFKETADIIHHK